MTDRIEKLEAVLRGLLSLFDGSGNYTGEGYHAYTVGRARAALERSDTAESPSATPKERVPRFDCETCGPGIAVDEDGCCTMCGGGATVVWSATPSIGPAEGA